MERGTPLIDIGVNLMHRSFHADREQVVERAAAVGISPLIITGTSVRSSREASQYAARYPGKLYATAGVHPHDAKDCSADTIQQLRQLAGQPQVVSIGNADWTITVIFRHVMYSVDGLGSKSNWRVS